MSRSQHEFDVWAYIARMGIKLRPARDTFFLDGDAVCAMRTCQYITQEDCEEFLHVDYKEFACSAPGCQAVFLQLIDSEAHYNAVHRHACSVCKKSLPTSHLLELHVIESHDSFFQVMSVKKPSYECFLEKCPLKFWNAQDRRQHSINDHAFPSDFKFDQSEKSGKPKGKKSKTENGVKSIESKKSVESPKPVEATSKMDVDPVIDAPRSRPEDVRLRQAPARNSPSHKIRPVSAFVSSEIRVNERSDPPTPKSSISSRTPPTYHRRLSLNASSKEASAQSPQVKRAPLSLARMGERMSFYGGSSIDVSSDQQATASTPLAGSVSTTAIHSSGSGTLPRSRIPSPTKSLAMSSTISKKSSVPSLPSTPKKLSQEESPNRSRIPVLRSSSYRVPKTISFGFGVPKVFPKRSADNNSGKHWHQQQQQTTPTRSKQAKTSIIENANFEDMRMALD